MAKRKKNIKKTSRKNVSKKRTDENTPIKTLGLKEFYFSNIKKLFYIPFIILLIAFFLIGQKIATTGDFINKGVSLSGGISLTISTSTLTVETLSSDMEFNFNNPDFTVRSISSGGEQKALILESAEIDAEDLTDFLKSNYALTNDDMALEQTGSTLGDRFFKQTGNAIIVALILMGLVVYAYYRSLVPSFAIMLAALSDMVITLAVFNIFGLKLTTAGIAAFLMLIGYSVDTNILLSTRVLKRKEGTVDERVLGAMGTGLMMNMTTIVAITVALFISESETITQIMTILLIGLIADMMNTWIQNVGILKIYLEKTGGK
ncbi:hypothetical protein C0585_00885 [Candidatus Woesearchaeota archaeon]|nr:MAG: hypothetical protein C0585_00885 [Candidatus Woesearchaeota archaeon]